MEVDRKFVVFSIHTSWFQRKNPKERVLAKSANRTCEQNNVSRLENLGKPFGELKCNYQSVLLKKNKDVATNMLK